jgi:hypothetical protein
LPFSSIIVVGVVVELCSVKQAKRTERVCTLTLSRESEEEVLKYVYMQQSLNIVHGFSLSQTIVHLLSPLFSVKIEFFTLEIFLHLSNAYCKALFGKNCFYS